MTLVGLRISKSTLGLSLNLNLYHFSSWLPGGTDHYKSDIHVSFLSTISRLIRDQATLIVGEKSSKTKIEVVQTYTPSSMDSETQTLLYYKLGDVSIAHFLFYPCCAIMS